MENPELFQEVNDVSSLNVGNFFRWMHTTSQKLSVLETKPDDVGGTPCCCETHHCDDNVGDQKIEVRGDLVHVDIDADDVGDDGAVDMVDDDVGDDGAVEMVDFQLENPLSDEKNWFYPDDDDDQIIHGPFTLEEFKGWMKDGYFAEDYIIRHGRVGEPVPLSDLLRVAVGGERCTRAEFIAHYGDTAEWDGAVLYPAV